MHCYKCNEEDKFMPTIEFEDGIIYQVLQCQNCLAKITTPEMKAAKLRRLKQKEEMKKARKENE